MKPVGKPKRRRKKTKIDRPKSSIYVVGYVRVSTEDQAEKDSIEAQEDYIRSWAEKEGWELLRIYKDDGYSGKDLNRPALQQLLRDAENHEFDAVICYHNDRLSRRTIDTLNIALQLKKLEIGLRFGNLDIDISTPEGEMLFTMLASFAQYFRRDLARKTSLGMQKRAKEGYHMGRVGDYFKIVEKRLIVKDKELVDKALKLRAEGETYENIAKALGIFLKNGRPNSMKVWRLIRTAKRIGYRV